MDRTAACSGRQMSQRRRAKVDAIIVPTARPVAYLKEAARAARSLGCPLVTLHSRKWTSAHAAADYLDPSVDLIAIDVPEPAQLRLPELETSRLLAGTIFERRTDLSTKRNLALVLSHMLRWKRVVFLDDDIRVPDPDDLSKAVGLLDTHTAVGLGIGGFPDNSVVCHAFRDGWRLAGDVHRRWGPGRRGEAQPLVLPQYLQRGLVLRAGCGEAAAVGRDRGRGPPVSLRPLPVPSGRGRRNSAMCSPRARSGCSTRASPPRMVTWRTGGTSWTKRKRFIEQVLGMVEGTAAIEPAERARMVEALKAALGRLAPITPELCVAYLQGTGQSTRNDGSATSRASGGSRAEAGTGARVAGPQQRDTVDLVHQGRCSVPPKPPRRCDGQLPDAVARA